jgi:signal transduction histidine kinase
MASSDTPRSKRRPPSGSRQKQLIQTTGPSRRKFAPKDSRELKDPPTRDLLIAQSKVLEALSGDATLKEMLTVFAETIERQSEGMLCSVLLLDGQTLRHGAAPSLPEEYNLAVDGLAIGPKVGSCGTAAYKKKQIIVSDIETDSLWMGYRKVARRYGLRACWSTPILCKNGEVLGTFALYYREPRKPNGHELQLMTIWSHLASLGIRRKTAQESLEAKQRLLHDLFKAQEYERRLTAYELHDGVTQYVTGAIMHLQSYVQTHCDGRMPAELEIVASLVKKAMEESRRLINGLRPPVLDESGVVGAIEHLIHEPSMAGLRVTFKHPEAFPRLAPVLEAAVYRIAQETLNNARRHSGSSKVKVTLNQNNDRIQLAVQDSGKGFLATKIPKERWGLRGICERSTLLGGSVAIDSAAGCP